MNIELRGEVLEKALILENAVNNLVLLYLGIDKEDRRAIGHKSGTLTYKNLLDLLYDIDVLDKQEFNTLLLLMEIRNQFMHNIDCDSFEKSIHFLGPDKGKRLLNFNRIGGNTLEEKYSNSFLGLGQDALDIILKKLAQNEKDIEEKSTYIKKLLKFIPEFSDMVHDKLSSILKKYTVPESELQNGVEHENNKMKILIQNDLVTLKLELSQKLDAFTTDFFANGNGILLRLIK